MSTSLTLSAHARTALLPILKEDLKIKLTDEIDTIRILEDLNKSAERLVGDVSKNATEEDILNNVKLLSIAEETIRDYVMFKYKLRNNNFESANIFKKEFLEGKESFITKSQSLRTGKSARHFANTTYEDDLLRVHGQDFGLGELL